MNTINRAIASACGAAVLAAVLIPAANACGGTLEPPFTMLKLKENPNNAMEAASAESVSRELRALSSGHAATIVGMWKSRFISMGNVLHNPSIPDGAQLDFGYSQWHSDGTELYNAGSRPPATQSFCMGVWTETGPSNYQANHFAITYDSTGAYSGTRNFVETVTLSTGGTKYSGNVVINVYDTKGNQTDHLTAQVTADRVTMDTTVTTGALASPLGRRGREQLSLAVLPRRLRYQRGVPAPIS